MIAKKLKIIPVAHPYTQTHRPYHNTVPPLARRENITVTCPRVCYHSALNMTLTLTSTSFLP